ncbi:MAG: hypothetical protein INR71_03835 [Terriglobus roseus]|nr:hypothetical protein [Terriglobus roseus]
MKHGAKNLLSTARAAKRRKENNAPSVSGMLRDGDDSGIGFSDAEQIAEQQSAPAPADDRPMLGHQHSDYHMIGHGIAEHQASEQQVAERRFAEQHVPQRRLTERELAERQMAEQHMAGQRLGGQQTVEEQMAERQRQEYYAGAQLQPSYPPPRYHRSSESTESAGRLSIRSMLREEDAE